MTQPRFNYSPELWRAFSGPQLSKDESLPGGLPEKPYQRYSRDARATDCSDTITELYRITGWGALEGHKVFYPKHILILKLLRVLLNNLKTTIFCSLGKVLPKRDGSKKIDFKPVRMPGDISKYLGGSAGMQRS